MEKRITENAGLAAYRCVMALSEQYTLYVFRILCTLINTRIVRRNSNKESTLFSVKSRAFAFCTMIRMVGVDADENVKRNSYKGDWERGSRAATAGQTSFSQRPLR